MGSRRFDSLGSVLQYASRSRFLSEVRGRYRLPKAVNPIGRRSITATGIARRGRSLGLIYAAMPARRSHRSIKCTNNLNIALSLALSWPRDAYSQIRGDTTSPSAKSKLFLGIISDPGQDRLDGSAQYLIQSPSKSNNNENAGLDLRTSMPVAHQWHQSPSSHKPPGSVSEGMIGQGEPSNSEEGFLEPGPWPSRRPRTFFRRTGELMPGYASDSVVLEQRVPGLASRKMGKSIALPGDMIAIKNMPGLNNSGLNNSPMSSDEVGPLKSLSFPDLKSKAVLYPAGEVLDSRSTVFNPIYRTVPARGAPIQPLAGGEERSIEFSGESKIIAESVHSMPSAQDLNRISDQVCSIIERKLLTERERRGLHG